MTEQIYWSSDLDSWSNNDADCIHFFYIPSKWWSIKAWKFAFKWRAEMHKKLMTKYVEKVDELEESVPVSNLFSKIRGERIKELEADIADLRKVLSDKQRLTQELASVIDPSAKNWKPKLCDLVGIVTSFKAALDANIEVREQHEDDIEELIGIVQKLNECQCSAHGDKSNTCQKLKWCPKTICGDVIAKHKRSEEVDK